MSKSSYILPIAAALAIGLVLVNEAFIRTTTVKNVRLYLVPSDDYTIKESCVETKYFIKGIFPFRFPVDAQVKVLDRYSCGTVSAREVIDGDRLDFFNCQNHGTIWKCSQPFGQYIRIPDAIAEAVKMSP